MRIYINNSTGNICLLTFINSDKGVFEMEYGHGWCKYTINKKVNPCVNQAIKNDFTEVGYL